MAIATLPETELRDPEVVTSIVKLSKDLYEASKLLSQQESRWLVQSYYIWQEHRKAAASRLRKAEEHGEPNEVLVWSFKNMRIIEEQIKNALDEFSKQYRVGNWLREIHGIGPVIAAGLLAQIDIRNRPHAGQIHSFAGLNPDTIWAKGQKRPWNAALKMLCWKAGESFIKVRNSEKDIYGKVYAKRKSLEWTRNLNGEFADQCTKIINSKNFQKSGTSYRFYTGQVSPSWARSIIEAGKYFPENVKATEVGDEVPMLPPAHINARASRYAVKLFLSHLHHVMYEDYYNVVPPKPYCFDHLDGHTDYFPPPNWPGDYEGHTMKKLLGDQPNIQTI